MPASRIGEIVAAARVLLEQVGIDAFTLRELASRVGMRAPSLYRHFADKQAIVLALVATGFTELAAAQEDAPRTALALSQSYRRFALAHPELYRLMFDRPLSREHLPLEIVHRAFAPIVEICEGSILEARVAWAFAHGMTSLELAGRFPHDADLDGIWQEGIARLAQKSR